MTKKKECLVCGETKKSIDFQKYSGGGWRDICKKCWAEEKERKRNKKRFKLSSFTIEFI